MVRWFLLAAVASLVPMLFSPMNVTVHPGAKIACQVSFLAFLLLASVAYLRSRGGRSVR